MIMIMIMKPRKSDSPLWVGIKLVRYGNQLQEILLPTYVMPRCDVSCANITSLSGHVLPWTNAIRYLGIFIVKSRAFKCSIH